VQQFAPQQVCVVGHAFAPAREQIPPPESLSPPSPSPPLLVPELLPLSAAPPEELESAVIASGIPPPPVSAAEPLSLSPPEELLL
jgi:hypothetical protein